LDAAAEAAFLEPIAGQLVDNYERSDRALDGDALPGSLVRWNVTGRGLTTAAIVSGRYQSTDDTFAYIDYQAPVTRIAGVFSFVTTGATDDLAAQQMGLIADPRTADEGLQNILHLSFGPRRWTLSKGGLEANSGAPRVTLASGTHSLQTDGTRYGIALEITAGAVTVIAPNGERFKVADPAVDVIAPAFAAFQITAAAGAPRGRWEAVSRNR
jgi:hypothetical protein